MDAKKLSLKIMPEPMTVCRLDASAPLPDRLDGCGFYSITRTEEELTLVCREALAPSGTKCESGWRCFRVQGELDFSEIGIMFSLTQPLAEAGVSVFAISTFDTDYFLVKEKQLARAIDALVSAGHRVDTEARRQMTDDRGPEDQSVVMRISDCGLRNLKGRKPKTSH